MGSSSRLSKRHRFFYWYRFLGRLNQILLEERWRTSQWHKWWWRLINRLEYHFLNRLSWLYNPGSKDTAMRIRMKCRIVREEGILKKDRFFNNQWWTRRECTWECTWYSLNYWN